MSQDPKPAKPWRPSPRVLAFLAAYPVTCSITRAAEAAGISRRAHYRLLERSPEYQARFEIAHDDAVDVLEREARRRAVEGVKRHVLYHGRPIMVPLNPMKKVGKRNPLVPLYETEYSDGLLTELLRANAPQKYAQRVKKELSGPGGGPIDSKLEIVFVGSDGNRIPAQTAAPVRAPSE